MATTLACCAWPSVPSKLYPPFTYRCLWCAPAMSEKSLLGPKLSRCMVNDG